MPPAFLPSVEQTSLMRPFTERVIAGALARAVGWAGGPLDAHIAVNVAAANLLDADFPATVARLLVEAGIAPDRLCIEVTENAVMADTRSSRRPSRSRSASASPSSRRASRPRPPGTACTTSAATRRRASSSGRPLPAEDLGAWVAGGGLEQALAGAEDDRDGVAA